MERQSMEGHGMDRQGMIRTNGEEMKQENNPDDGRAVYHDRMNQEPIRSATSTPNSTAEIKAAAREVEQFVGTHTLKPLGSVDDKDNVKIQTNNQPNVGHWPNANMFQGPNPIMSPGLNPGGNVAYGLPAVYGNAANGPGGHQNLPMNQSLEQQASFNHIQSMSFNQILNPNFSQGNNLSFFQRLQGFAPSVSQGGIPAFVDGSNAVGRGSVYPPVTPVSPQHSNQHYKCTDKYCGKIFDTEKLLLDHLQTCRATEEALGLVQCGSKQSENPAKRNTFSYTCADPTCREHFVSKSALQYHTKVRHSQKIYCCQIRKCDLTFTTDSDLKLHLKDVHDLPYACPEKDCGKAFKHMKPCMKHVASVHAKIHEQFGGLVDVKPGSGIVGEINRCPHEGCAKTFKNKYILETHMTTHSDERLFQCQVEGCWKTYRTKGALKQHGAKQHSITENMKSFLATQRPFKCPEAACIVAFDTKGKLKMHLDDHNKIRPYRCSEPDCGKAFKCRAGLSSHSVCHREERPFPCTVEDCKKCFKTRVVRDQHEKTHFK